jgi:hypothetical protein
VPAAAAAAALTWLIALRVHHRLLRLSHVTVALFHFYQPADALVACRK